MISELNIRPFQAILSDYSGFSWLKTAKNDYCVTCHKAFSYDGSHTSLIYELQRAHPIHAFLFLLKLTINQSLIFKKLTIKMIFIFTSPALNSSRGELATRDEIYAVKFTLPFVEPGPYPEFFYWREPT